VILPPLVFPGPAQRVVWVGRRSNSFNLFIQENKAGLNTRGFTGQYIDINTGQINWGGIST